MDLDLRGIAFGFAAAILVLGALVWVVGAGDVSQAFAALDPAFVGLIVAAAMLWLAAWGMALRAVLGALEVPTGAGTAFLLYAAAAFANNVTPFGQAGGEPFSALLISRATDTSFEDGLAAIASVDALNFAPSIALALLGVGYYVTAFAVGSRNVAVLLASVVALAIAVPALGYVGWRHRERVRGTVVGVLGPLLRAIARIVPRVTPPTPERLRERVDAFFGAVERVADDRDQVVTALAFSTLGWLAMMGALALSLAALGHTDPRVLVAALVVVPLGGIASATPLPGGLGGVEFVLVALIVPIAGLSADAATAAALVFRGATYWLPTVVGGGAAAWLEGRGERTQ